MGAGHTYCTHNQVIMAQRCGCKPETKKGAIWSIIFGVMVIGAGVGYGVYRLTTPYKCPKRGRCWDSGRDLGPDVLSILIIVAGCVIGLPLILRGAYYWMDCRARGTNTDNEIAGHGNPYGAESAGPAVVTQNNNLNVLLSAMVAAQNKSQPLPAAAPPTYNTATQGPTNYGFNDANYNSNTTYGSAFNY